MPKEIIQQQYNNISLEGADLVKHWIIVNSDELQISL